MTSRKIASVLLFVVLFSNVLARRNFDIFLEHCNCTINPIYVERCICDVDKTVSPPTCNIDVQMHHQLNEFCLSFDVFLIRKNNEKFTLFNATDIDACSLMDRDAKTAQPLVRMLKEIFVKTGNLPKKCPVDKDYHFIFNNITIDSEEFPPYVPETAFGIYSRFTQGKNFMVLFETYGNVVQRSKNRWAPSVKMADDH